MTNIKDGDRTLKSLYKNSNLTQSYPIRVIAELSNETYESEDSGGISYNNSSFKNIIKDTLKGQNELLFIWNT